MAKVEPATKSAPPLKLFLEPKPGTPLKLKPPVFRSEVSKGLGTQPRQGNLPPGMADPAKAPPKADPAVKAGPAGPADAPTVTTTTALPPPRVLAAALPPPGEKAATLAPAAPPNARRPDAEKLKGLEPTAFYELFGTPDLLRRDQDAQILQYKGSRCILDVFLYEEASSGRYLATYLSARNISGEPTDLESCLRNLVPDRNWPEAYLR